MAVAHTHRGSKRAPHHFELAGGFLCVTRSLSRMCVACVHASSSSAGRVPSDWIFFPPSLSLTHFDAADRLLVGSGRRIPTHTSGQCSRGGQSRINLVLPSESGSDQRVSGPPRRCTFRCIYRPLFFPLFLSRSPRSRGAFSVRIYTHTTCVYMYI